jgi:hypothetical protein
VSQVKRNNIHGYWQQQQGCTAEQQQQAGHICRLEHVWEFSLALVHDLEILIWQLIQSIHASEFSTVRS